MGAANPAEQPVPNRGNCYCTPAGSVPWAAVAFRVYLKLWTWQLLALIGFGPLANIRKPPPGYCGWCMVCHKPGHVRPAPDGPYTGAWCDTHWDELVRPLVNGSHRNFPDLAGRNCEALFVEEFWTLGQRQDAADRIYIRARDLSGVWFFFSDHQLFCIDDSTEDPVASSPEPDADVSWSYVNLLTQFNSEALLIRDTVFGNPFVITLSDGSVITYTERDNEGKLQIVVNDR